MNALKPLFLRLLLPVLLVGGAVALGAAAALFKVPVSAPNEVVAIAEGVWFRHGDLDAQGHCNNGIIRFQDFILVVDANFPGGAEACLADIPKLSDKPVRFVVDTHHHGDHAYGNSVWFAKGATPVAHEKAAQEMRRLEPGRWREAMGREDVKRTGRDSPMPPVATFSDRLVLDDGTRRVEILHFGTAHTRGDGFVYLPKEKILFTGDAVVNGPYNFMGDGNSESWIRVLDKLLELDIELVVPGHGPCGAKDLILQQRGFFSALRQRVADGIRGGQNLEQIQTAGVELLEPSQRYAGKSLASQIAKVYAELAGGELPLELEELGLEANLASARAPEAAAPRKVVAAVDPRQVPVAELQRAAAELQLSLVPVPPRDNAAILREVADADGLIGGISAEAIRAGKKLRWVHSISAGVEPYLGVGSAETPGIAELASSPIVLTNGRRCYGPNIADQVFGFLLALTRGIQANIQGKALAAAGKSRWAAVDPEPFQEVELRGKTMLIIGLGGIGGQVAQRAAAFGLRVQGVDAELSSPPPGVQALRRPEALKELLPQAEVLVLACPLTPKTRGLIGKAELALLPRGAYLINVARGRIVDSEALVEALRSGQLAGAGLDVTEPEPLPDTSPLWSLPNVIISPHNAGQSEGSRRRVFLLVRENLRRFARGEPLLNVVDKAKGY